MNSGLGSWQIKALHLYDCLRANKSTSAWGLEARVPFLDKNFINVAMSIDPEWKMVIYCLSYMRQNSVYTFSLYRNYLWLVTCLFMTFPFLFIAFGLCPFVLYINLSIQCLVRTMQICLLMRGKKKASWCIIWQNLIAGETYPWSNREMGSSQCIWWWEQSIPTKGMF